MAGDPHNKDGKCCSVCGKPFTKNSFYGTLTRPEMVSCQFEGEEKQRMYRVAKDLCQPCLNEHYSKGE